MRYIRSEKHQSTIPDTFYFTDYFWVEGEVYRVVELSDVCFFSQIPTIMSKIKKNFICGHDLFHIKW